MQILPILFDYFKEKNNCLGLRNYSEVLIINYDDNSNTFKNCKNVSFNKAGKCHKIYDLNVRLVLGLRNTDKGRVTAEKL